MLERSAALLEERVAVVTGGGGGIGRSIALSFARFGASVVVAERDAARAASAAEAIEARGGRALAQVVDVEDDAQVDALRDASVDAFGRVDVLVNNVGDYFSTGPFLESKREDWQRLYSANLHHVFACCQAFAPGMVERGRGSIINLSTIEALRGTPKGAAYSAFNAGVDAFTRSFALEVAPHGVRVNAIAPDTTDTLQLPLGDVIPPERAGLTPFWNPLGRFGTPDDVAGCAIFLASELSAWMTGQTLVVDGGALAAAGFYRVPATGQWTNKPVIAAAGTDPE